MTTIEKTIITVEATIKAPVEKVWTLWTDPQHIVSWNSATEEWHTPKAQNDLRTGGQFNFRMESKDGSIGFDFTGTYIEVVENKKIAYTLEDDRKVEIEFTAFGNETLIKETFEAEGTHPVEMQRDGWQAILNNFKKYAEAPGT